MNQKNTAEQIDAQCDRILILLDAFEKPYIEAEREAQDKSYSQREKRIDELLRS